MCDSNVDNIDIHEDVQKERKIWEQEKCLELIKWDT